MVDFINDSIVMKSGFQGIISEDWGSVFCMIGNSVYFDIYDIWIDLINNKYIFVVIDGGIYESIDYGCIIKMWMNLLVF